MLLWVPLRRFACPEGHHRPWEQRGTVGEHVTWTQRLSRQVRQEYLHGCPCRPLARRSGLSARTVFRGTFEKSRGGRPRKVGRAIGIDEYARRKGHRDNTLLGDLAEGTPLPTFKGRRGEEGIAWFQSRPHAARDQGEVVGMDMSKTYASAIQALCGEQGHVIDRFHVGQLAVSALEGVLRSGSQQRDAEEAKSLKKLRKRGRKSANQRDGDALIARYAWRRRFPE